MKTSYFAIIVLVLASVMWGCKAVAPTKSSTHTNKMMKCESHGSFVRCALHDANRRHVSLHNETSQSKCIKGDTWGADSDGIWVDDKCKGVFYYSSDEGHHEDYKERHKHHEGKSGDCPSDIRGNECEYYKDGYNAGKQDAKMSMSSAYERHSDAYDRRFKNYYAKGYKDGWNNYR